MAYARMASRLKLLGLLLICTSVLVFLVLSACGVDSVRINTPLAQRLARQWQLTSAESESLAAETSSAAGSLLAATPAFDPRPQYGAAPGGAQILPPTYPSGSDAFGAPVAYTTDTTVAAADDTVETAATAVGLRIPLWCIIAVFLLIGFVLWSMPQPRPAAHSAGRRR